MKAYPSVLLRLLPFLLLGTAPRVASSFSLSASLGPNCGGEMVSRCRFLSYSAAAVLGGTANVERCSASEWVAKNGGAGATSGSGAGGGAKKTAPRYLDYEMEMKYADGPDGNPRSRGVFVRRFTGDSTPYTFPVRPVRLVKEWPEAKPFSEEDFFRADNNDDKSFYVVPRFVYHIDEPAVSSLTQYYRTNIKKGSSILDICSSWVSHYPLEFPAIMKRISGTGMNGLELRANDQLTDFEEKDLNVDYQLPYPDGTFDAVTCVVSVDYLIHPVEVLKEVNRVLKPGGKVIISQSNRCFPSKAIAMWLKMNDRQHLELINGYLQYAGGFKSPAKAFDITAEGPQSIGYNPMFIVEAVKA